MGQGSFLHNVHTFRAFAIFGVVAAHSLFNFRWPEESLTFSLADTFFNQSTVWFAFIAGFLFQHLLGRFETRKYYRSKLRNVITPYLIWSIPALLAAFTLVDQEMPRGFDLKSLPEQIMLFLLTGRHLAPFWYIPAISLIFLIGPVLHRLDRTGWGYWLVIPLLILSGVLGRDGLLPTLGLSSYFNQTAKATYLLGPYVLGMFASRYRSECLAFTRRWWIPMTLVSVGLYLWEALLDPQSPAPMLGFKCVSSFLFLVLFQRTLGRLQPAINLVAEYSFGIFFLHGFLLGAHKVFVFSVLGWEELPAGNAVFHLAFAALVVAACLGLLQVTKMVLRDRSRLVVGC